MEFAVSLAPDHFLDGHIERPDRVDAVASRLREFTRGSLREVKLERLATSDDIGLVHKYYDDLKESIVSLSDSSQSVCAHTPTVKVLNDDGDPDGVTFATASTFDDARRAVGTTLELIDRLLNTSGNSSAKFAVVRPPGHHAGVSTPCGFCIFNNVAVAAAYAKNRYGLRRILIVDFDLHNGNGTAEIFYSDPSVTVFDLHEASNVYPERDGVDDTGEGEGIGSTLNIPLACRSGHNSAIRACELLRLCASNVHPELVLVSAGFDGHAEDPFNTVLGKGLGFSEDTYSLFGYELTSIARQYCNGRILYALEGGYNCSALSSSFEALVHGCMMNAEKHKEVQARHGIVRDNDGDLQSLSVLDSIRSRLLGG
jgi:acetoin utilization deacetylase AcuC-like enzyme